MAQNNEYLRWVTGGNVQAIKMVDERGYPLGGIVHDAFGRLRVAANTASGGVQMESGYFSNANDAITVQVGNKLKLGSAIDGTLDEVWLCVRPSSNNESVAGALNWKEIV